MKKNLFLIGLITLSLFACKDNANTGTTDSNNTPSEAIGEREEPNESTSEMPNENQESNQTAIIDGHNSENSLDWQGTYKGTLPCDVCEGIEIEVTLNEDKTYALKSTYLGKESYEFVSEGAFSWNDAGSAVSLDVNDEEGAHQYKVGENVLIKLDNKGKPFTGSLADQYRLNKQ